MDDRVFALFSNDDFIPVNRVSEGRRGKPKKLCVKRLSE